MRIHEYNFEVVGKYLEVDHDPDSNDYYACTYESQLDLSDAIKLRDFIIEAVDRLQENQ